MRPNELKIEGLRSFGPRPTRIDLRGKRQIAIIGSTGAGKSSILEAMTYALYGQATFSAQANQDLINDESEHLRVRLTFEAQGREWMVARLVSRRRSGEAGPASATLQATDGSGRAVEGVQNVNREVTRIVGLDAAAFLRTIVLPQGRFARLLADDEPRARALTLRQIWQTGDLERAAVVAGEAATGWEAAATRLDAVSTLYPADIDNWIAELTGAAGDRSTEAALWNERADKAAKLAQRAARAETARRLAGTADAAAQRIAGAVKTAAQRLGELEHERTRIRADGEYARRDEDAAGQVLAGSDGDASENHRAADAEARAWSEVLEATQKADSREAATRTAAEFLDKAAEDAEKADQAAATKDADGRRLRGLSEMSTRQAETAVETARKLDERFHQWERGSAAAARRSGERARAARSRAEDTRRRQAQAGDPRQAAEAAHERAAAELEAAGRELAAARAAENAAAGDPCPVCERPLPAGWTPANADVDRLQAARARRDETAAVRDETRDTMRALEESVRIEEQHAAEAEGEANAAATTSELEWATLCAAAKSDPQEPRTAATINGRARRIAEQRNAERDETRGAATSAEQAAEQARTGAAVAQTRREAATDKSAGLLREAADARRLASAKWEATAGGQQIAPRSRTAEQATRRLDAAAGRRDGLAAAASRADAARNAKQHAAERRLKAERQERSDIAEPMHRIELEMERLDGELNVAAGESELALAPAPGEEPADTGERAGRVGRRAGALAGLAERSAAAAGQMLLEAINEAGELGDNGDLQQMAARTASEADAARRNADDATRRARDASTQQDGVREIRLLLQTARSRARALREIEADLKPGGFPKWLTLRRSAELLRHASRELEEMTGGRYGFRDPRDTDEQWKILDRATGISRVPTTLSGGEQFLASLALALGMVETVGQRGGRLEAFFLDEGFGTLDRQTLDSAVDALARRADREHLVGVITHVREVAERIEDVLAVERAGPQGSTVRWLTREERELAADGRAAGGLTSVS